MNKMRHVAEHRVSVTVTIHRKDRMAAKSDTRWIANNSSTRKIIFDWIARALELGRRKLAFLEPVLRW